MARAWIGTSGYNYKSWADDFYPAGLAQTKWLPYYAQRFDTVEINYSFYQLPTEKTFRTWSRCVPHEGIDKWRAGEQSEGGDGVTVAFLKG